MSKPWWKGTFEERMAHRRARRERITLKKLEARVEAQLFASASAAHSRACSRAAKVGAKQPVFRPFPKSSPLTKLGGAFDWEEYETRKADRRASDPKFQARLKARKERQRELRDQVRYATELDRANAEMAEEVKLAEKVGVGRLRDIWYCIIHQDNEEKWRKSPTLSQKSRIAVTPRIKGCGAAAKRAGFAA